MLIWISQLMIELCGNLTALWYISATPLAALAAKENTMHDPPGASGLASLAIRELLLFSLTERKMLAARPQGDHRGRRRRHP